MDSAQGPVSRKYKVFFNFTFWPRVRSKRGLRSDFVVLVLVGDQEQLYEILPKAFFIISGRGSNTTDVIEVK